MANPYGGDVESRRFRNQLQKREALLKNREDSKRTRLIAWRKRMKKLGYTTDATNTAFNANGTEVGSFEGGMKKSLKIKKSEKKVEKKENKSEKKVVKKEEKKVVVQNKKENKQGNEEKVEKKVENKEKLKVPKYVRNKKTKTLVSTKTNRGKQILKLEERKRKLIEKRFGKK